MTSLQKYREYFSNNPEGYWFKRKVYGWGWTPVKWEGWAVLLLAVAYIIGVGVDFTRAVPRGTVASTDVLTWFFIKIAFGIAVLIGMCYWKGESPRWQWGLPNDDSK